MPVQMIDSSIRVAFTGRAVALTRRTRKYDSDMTEPTYAAAKSCCGRRRVDCDFDHWHSSVVCAVGLGGMAITLYRECDAEAPLSEAQPEATSAGEEIHRRRPKIARQLASALSAKGHKYAFRTSRVLTSTDRSTVMDQIDMEPLPHLLGHRRLERIVIPFAAA